MTVEEIKLRQMTNQHLVTPAPCKTVLHDLCGVQAQFVSNAVHGLKIRSSDFCEADAAVLVKSWTIRGTMHLFAEDDLPLMLHKGRGHYLRPCDTMEGDEYITRRRKEYFARLILEGIADGTDTREALKELCRDKGMTEREAESVFNPWGGTIRALCERGDICHKAQEKKAFRQCPAFEPMERDSARLELARRYFTHFGPATVNDAAYFFGAAKAQVKNWLSQLPVESAVCGGRTYYYIDSGRAYNGEIPACLFLAGFDQLMLGYQKTESLYLPPEHLRGIFNLAGIVMPALLLHGRVAGKWKQKGSKLTVTLFEAVSAGDRRLIEEKAALQWPGLRAVELV